MRSSSSHIRCIGLDYTTCTMCSQDPRTISLLDKRDTPLGPGLADTFPLRTDSRFQTQSGRTDRLSIPLDLLYPFRYSSDRLCNRHTSPI